MQFQFVTHSVTQSVTFWLLAQENTFEQKNIYEIFTEKRGKILTIDGWGGQVKKKFKTKLTNFIGLMILFSGSGYALIISLSKLA